MWKRLDEHRELAELLLTKAPNFLREHPWLAQWFRSQDVFLEEAFSLSGGEAGIKRIFPTPAWLRFCDQSRLYQVRPAPGWIRSGDWDELRGIQLCPKCHPQVGCGHEHSFDVADTGTCSLCGETNEVWDCKLVGLASELGISDHDVWEHLPRLQCNKQWDEVEEKYRQFANKNNVKDNG